MSALSIGDVVTTVSVLIAAIAIWQSRFQNIRQSQLQTLLGVGGEYREAWRQRWRVLPAALAAADGDPTRLSPPDFETLVDALNWIDWFGVACRDRIVHHEDFVFATVGPSMLGLIDSGGQLKITGDEQRYGASYWSGVRYVQRRLIEIGTATSSAAWTAAQNAPPQPDAD